MDFFKFSGPIYIIHPINFHIDSPGRMGGRNPDYISGGYNPARDSRTLTWDRNPKPDRNDPKYFPVNSLPRHPGQQPQPGGGHPAAGNSINR